MNNLNTFSNSFKDYIYLLFYCTCMFSNYLHVPSYGCKRKEKQFRK